MNAYELADELETRIATKCFEITKQSANMLRQQADRIAELEKKLQESAMNYISICSQADEHYARVQELEKELKRTKFVWNLAENEIERLAPQTKPLSDEEIDSIIYLVDWAYDPVLLARAIEERHGIK